MVGAYLKGEFLSPLGYIQGCINRIKEKGALGALKDDFGTLENKIRKKKFKKGFRSFIKLLDNLDIDWYFTSGFCTKVYANPSREINDIDVVVKPKDMKKVEEELDGKIKERLIEKGSGTLRNLGFKVKYKGLNVEVMNGLIAPEHEEFLNKMHEMKVKCEIFG